MGGWDKWETTVGLMGGYLEWWGRVRDEVVYLAGWLVKTRVDNG